VSDVMTTYWFRPKRYGYGATPISWEGWAVTAVGVVVIAASTLMLVRHTALDQWFWVAIAIDVVAIVGLLAVSRRKTDGEWRWRWGDR
jgi:O-antigen/teichoic acid export membrane protein